MAELVQVLLSTGSELD